MIGHNGNDYRVDKQIDRDSCVSRQCKKVTGGDERTECDNGGHKPRRRPPSQPDRLRISPGHGGLMQRTVLWNENFDQVLAFDAEQLPRR